jgi:hypothetical protein
MSPKMSGIAIARLALRAAVRSKFDKNAQLSVVLRGDKLAWEDVKRMARRRRDNMTAL